MSKVKYTLTIVILCVSSTASSFNAIKWFADDEVFAALPISPPQSTLKAQTNSLAPKNGTVVKIDLKTSADDEYSPRCRCVSRHYCSNGKRIRQGKAVNTPVCRNNGEVMCCQDPFPGCGVVEKFPSFRPFPGFGEANYGEFPWTALILDGREDIIYGTGIVISSNMVLTTARNIQHISRGRPVRVRLGEWDLASDIEPFPVQEFFMQDIIPHKGFNSKTYQNDLAVIRLNASIDFQAFPAIRPVCLARAGEDLKYMNSRCFTAGWGSKPDTRIVAGRNLLKKVDLKLHDAAVCERAIRRGVENPEYHWDDESFICAGGEQGKGLCRGDEGAALVCRDAGTGERYALVGMSSWATTCGQGGFPGVFTNIATFSKWIQSLDDRV